VLFNEAYANADIERYYLGPVLWVWTWLGIFAAEVAILAGYAAGQLVGRVRASDGRHAERGTIAAAAVIAVLMLVPTLMNLEATRRTADRSNDRGAQAWLDEVLPVIPRDAVLISWWSTSTPMWYAQHVLGLRPDILVLDDRTLIDRRLGRAPDAIRRYLAEGRPVYAIRLQGRDTDELTRQFFMTPVASGGHTTVWAVHGPLVAAQ
jgi:hypothetical protein